MNLSSDEDEGGKRDPVKIVAGHIGKFKDLLMAPKGARSHVENRLAEGNRTGGPIDLAGLTMAAKVYPEYQASLREANAADFGDLLLWSTLALVNDVDYRARWAGKFDWVHADEYQDVNFAQYTWLKTLASHARRMFVVGDDDQSIYGWRGADVAFIRRSRAFEEALMPVKIRYRLVGDVGFYARAEIKDAPALLRLAAMPDDRQSNEAFRRVINEPRRGFVLKAIEILEQDASFFDVSLLKAVETAALPPKTKEAGVQFVKHIRVVAGNTTLTLADQLSLLLDRTGYRAMLRESRAENMEQKLENLGELLDIAGGFHNARELLDHAALATNHQGARVSARLPARLRGWHHPLELWRRRRRAQARLCRPDARNAPGPHLLGALSPRTSRTLPVRRRHP